MVNLSDENLGNSVAARQLLLGRTMKRTIVAALLVFLPLAGCMVGEIEGIGTAPPAPTELKATPVSGGIHLTWKDNSTDEMHFMVMRMMHDHDDHGAEPTMKPIATVDPNVTAYHDTTIESGMTYMYMVGAMGEAGGESDSNEVELVAP
jgi:fibronectin type 3 domain-containing protein